MSYKTYKAFRCDAVGTKFVADVPEGVLIAELLGQIDEYGDPIPVITYLDFEAWTYRVLGDSTDREMPACVIRVRDLRWRKSDE